MNVEKEVMDEYLRIVKTGEKYLHAACTLDVPRKLFLKEYEKLPPIEKLSEEEKKDLKDYVIMNFKGKDKFWLIDTCKVIYTINYFL
jgi:hypothetical protein